MHSQVLAKRNAQAHARSLAAVHIIAERAELPGAVATLAAATHRDPLIAALRQREAMADFLEALVQRMLPPGSGDPEPAAPDISMEISQAAKRPAVEPESPAARSNKAKR